MKVKDGSYVIIASDDVQSFYKLFEITYKGEINPLYKVYFKNRLVAAKRFKEKLSELPVDMIEGTDVYDWYVDTVTDDFDTEYEARMDAYRRNKKAQERGYNKVTGSRSTSRIDNMPRAHTSEYNSEWQAYRDKWEKERQAREKGTTGLAKDLKKSDTLVIHCADKSTEMLSQMYEGKNYDVLRDGSINKEELHELLNCHKRIIMLGHGTGGGLINVQSSKGGSWCVIGAPEAPLLKDKQLFVIWCNADSYFNTHHIGEGQFITGNMPSEVWECRAAGCGEISAQEMLDNITYWSKLCGDVTERCLNGDVANSVRYIREEYIKKYGDHPVTVYNSVRTKVQGTSMEQNEKEVEEIYKKLGKEVPKVKQPTYTSYSGYGGYGSYGGRGIFDLNNDEQDDW